MAKKNLGGRPSIMTDQVIAKLESAFSMGASDREACVYADIVPSTLYRYCQEHPEFSERKEMLKDKVVLLARQKAMEAIKSGDVQTIRWMIDKKDGKPIQKQQLEHTGENGGPVKIQKIEYIDPRDNDT